MKTSQCSLLRAVSAFAGFFASLSSLELYASSDVTISTGVTSGGSFAGTNPNVFTPTAASAVANNGTIQTSLNGGNAVTINTASAAGGNGDLTVSATVSKTAGGSGTLTLNAVRDLVINGAISSSSGALPLALNAGRNMSNSQTLTSNGGNITLSPAQTFTVGANLNAGVGQVLLQSGSLESSSAFALTGASVQVASSAAFRLHGTVAGDLSVSGSISPAPAGNAGNLQVNGAFTLQSSATTVIDIGGTGGGSSYDRISATGDVTVAGALQVNLVNAFHDTIDGGSVFTIVQGGSVTGVFTGYPNGSRYTLANDYGSLRVNYTATSVTLDDWQPVIVDLTWDPGTAEGGTQVFTNTNTRGGRHYFHVTTQSTDIGAWRTRLTPSSGDAALYLKKTSIPTTSSYHFSSTQSGSDGIMLRDDQFAAGEEWYILVNATSGAQWSLFSGRAFVNDLGSLPFTDSNSNLQYDIGEAVAPQSAPATPMPPEGIRFYRSEVPTGTPAWSLWLNGSTRDIAVRTGKVPFHSSSSYYARKQTGQMLVVPTVLGTGSSAYFMSVEAPKGESIGLDSRIQFVTDISFDSTTSNVVVSGAPYRVYRTQVPIDQLAWDVSTTAVAGNPNVCVRKDNVPGEWDNDAFSEAPGSATDSVTLVPDFLTNGTWFITVYGTGNYTFTLKSGDPVITPISFTDLKTNDQTTRAGWRYYALTDIPSQVGSLGWELLLSNQVSGTMISIRRNKVPSRWLYRVNGNMGGPSDTNFSYMDYHGENGFLQRPGHQADVWYVGIYTPQQPLGAFQLNVHPITPSTVGFDGSNTAVTGLEPGRWRFQRIDVPAGVTGWDVRVKNVTGTGVPQLVVRRDQLPQSVGTGGWSYPYTFSAWPSGYSWTETYDWTSRSSDAGSSEYLYNRRLVMGTGAPLEAGTYYVGVYNNDSTNTTNYTLESRGIGTGQSVPVAVLNFASGSNAAITNLAPRESAYYKVTIPASTPSWEFTLATTSGEMMMCARRGAIPDFMADYDYADIQRTDVKEEVRVQKDGPERYVLLPRDGQDFIQAGDYYIAVISEGQSPSDNSHTGTGTSSGVLTSNGTLVTTSLGAVSLAGINQPVSLFGGQLKSYSFTVPAGTASLEVRLDNRTGNPQMSLVDGSRIPDPTLSSFDGYGFGGGQSSGTVAQKDDNLITLANPAAGTYSLTLRADSSSSTVYPDATANLVIVSSNPTPVTFDGGTVAITNQAPTAWRFFQITVPSGIEGWDVRVKNVTGDGTPQLVVRRDLLPQSVGTAPWSYPYTSSTWPSGNSWGEPIDWTHRSNDAGSSSSVTYRRLVTGAGAPLEPGTYYVGIYNSDLSNAASYTLESRGIGTGQSVPVTALNYASGSSSAINSLAPREAAYFKVTIPANTPSWEFTVGTTTGEMMMCARRGAIPDFMADSDYYDIQRTDYKEEVFVQKTGPERYVLLPRDGLDFLQSGDYYIAVVSEGLNPSDGNHTGPDPSSGVLTSNGALVTTNLGTASLAGINQAVSLLGGQLKSYSFTVPAGTSSLEVRLDNRTGNPWMALVSGSRIPDPSLTFSDGYGFGGGQISGTVSARDESLITVANPAAGTYSLTLRADYQDSTYADATANLVVVANGPVPVAFDGGTAAITNQAATAWRYFQITVPSGVEGWDVKVRDVTGGGVPQLVVRRDQLPQLVSTSNWSYPYASNSWPTGYSWTESSDWSNRPYDAGNNIGLYYRRLVMGNGGPLEPGTYYVGVYNADSTNAISYTLESRGIGTGRTLPVTALNYAAGSSATITDLEPREAAYYKVTIPANTPSWEFTLATTTGEMMMCVRRGAIPDFQADSEGYDIQRTDYKEEVRVQKAGPERYVLLPRDEQNFIQSGDYYIAVVSEGVNPSDGSHTGTGPSSGVLTSNGALATTNLGAASLAGINQPVSLLGGQVKSYSFTVPAGTAALELRLDNRVGNPVMSLVSGSRIADPTPGYYDSYGFGGGQYSGAVSVMDDNLITISNPAAGTYSLTLRADYVGSTYDDATANLVVRQLARLPLNYASSLNGNGQSNTASRQLLDTQKDFFEVPIPTTIGGQPVIGWLIKVALLQGDTTMRIYKTWGNSGSGITIAGNTALVVPPFLTPGDTWFVEVQASGLTNYTITSYPITLERPVWTMPTGHNTTFGDSGNDSGGVPLPGDRGVDIGQDDWHFYAIDVPAGNAGLLRTELQAINGNPNLYIREDGVPTTDHYANGQTGATLAPRYLTAAGSEYGNWVPIDGRYESQLRTGRWYLGVKATGGTNARYRLIVSTGQVTDLTLNGGSVTNQILVGRDWRYYRFTVPADAPNNWSLTFSQQVGDVNMWLRDTIPPGNAADGLESVDGYYFNYYGVKSWYYDNKNQGPYNYTGQDAAGTYPFNTPPLRPGSTYYVGFRADNDATFSFSSATSGGTIGTFTDLDYYTGTINTSVPAGGSLIYRIPVPSEATRMKWTASHPSSVQLRLEQGTLPGTTGAQHWTSGTSSDVAFNQSLTNLTSGWPWLPNKNYYLRVMNTSGSSQAVVLTMNGKNAATEDEDGDGLPDAWEVLYFGYAYLYTGASDPDGDGVTNAVEFADGTNPNDSNSAKYSLTFAPFNGAAGKSPDLPKYNRGAVVNLTDTPTAGYSFVGWMQQGSFDSDFAVKATGTVTIPSSGTYTFGTSAADGVRLKVNNVVVISDDNTHGTADRFGEITLTAGTYPLELTAFENANDDALELFAAAGSHASFNSNFKLLGDTASGGLVVQTISGVSTVPGLTVQQIIGVGTGNIYTLARMDELLAGTRVKRAETTIISQTINYLGGISTDGHFAGNVSFPLLQANPANPLALSMYGDYTIAALNGIPLASAVDAPSLTFSTSGDAPWLGELSAQAFDTVDHARSGPIDHNQYSAFSTTVTGPGTLTFRWKVSSEPNYDRLQFLVNGSFNQQISGEQPYALVTYDVPAGPQTLTWRYGKDYGVSVGSDRGWVDQISFAQTRYTLTVNASGGTVGRDPAQADYAYGTVVTLTATPDAGNTFVGWSGALTGSTNPATVTMDANKTVTANFGISLPVALDTPSLTYTLGGNGNWFGQSATTHDGVDAAQSGFIGFNQETWLETTVTGPGNLSFWWKVSSENNFDWLEFYVDGSLQSGRISGAVDWQQKTFAIGAGNHTLRWRYSTDYGLAVGSDCGWVDQIVWTPDNAYSAWQSVYFTPAEIADPSLSGPLADFDRDGIPNLMEFATAQLPKTSGALPVSFTKVGGTLQFVYTRNKAAASGGVTFIVEWSDDLGASSWSTVGVTENAVDQGATELVTASIPAGSGGQRFVRLRVTMN